MNRVAKSLLFKYLLKTEQDALQSTLIIDAFIRLEIYLQFSKRIFFKAKKCDKQIKFDLIKIRKSIFPGCHFSNKN
jgi:hypothetical protein